MIVARFSSSYTIFFSRFPLPIFLVPFDFFFGPYLDFISVIFVGLIPFFCTILRWTFGPIYIYIFFLTRSLAYTILNFGIAHLS